MENRTMEIEAYLRFVAALALVLGLIAAVAWGARRLGLAGRLPIVTGRARRLGVVETVPLDAKHRLVLVRRDAAEHLLLLGPAGAAVVEAGIGPPPVDSPEDSGEIADESAADRAATEAVPTKVAR